MRKCLTTLLYAVSGGHNFDMSRANTVHGSSAALLREEPVFIFTIHRSGGTLLMRVLNCHPALVIWGEHGGFINKLTDADLMMRSLSDL